MTDFESTSIISSSKIFFDFFSFFRNVLKKMDSVVPIENGPAAPPPTTGDIESSFAEFFQDHQQKAENEIYSDLPPLNERKQGLP